jgi:hypothetical protein
MTHSPSTFAKLAAFGLVALAAAPAAAQEATTTSTQSFTVVGNVPPLCSGGTLTGGNTTFDLGVLIDTTTGLLRTDLAAPPKTLTGAFCTARSSITVQATAMAAQNFTAVPPAGFSRTVNYTATASGWTTTPATFTTGATANAGSVQTRDTAFTGPITVSLANFATGGGAALRLVSDTRYAGTVTVTLAAVN